MKKMKNHFTGKMTGQGSAIRKAGGYRKYFESLKQFKLSSNKVGRNVV